MARWAIVRGETVENTILWDGESAYEAPAGTTVVALGNAVAAPGYSYVNGEFFAPTLPADEPAA
jgi:hypothetical protein